MTSWSTAFGQVSVTVMVPNSLGRASSSRILDRRADAVLLRACQGLAIRVSRHRADSEDPSGVPFRRSGVVIVGASTRRRVLGFAVTWDKRHHVGPVGPHFWARFRAWTRSSRRRGEDIGSVRPITSHSGVVFGRRHMRSIAVFQNGPNSGKEKEFSFDGWIWGPPMWDADGGC
jgi:acyl-CoA dehydrogenase